MPETEMFRLILNGGSFALIVFLIIWALFKLEPNLRGMMEKKDLLNSQTIQKIIDGQTAQVQELVKTFSAMVQKANDDCREERKDWADAMAKEMKMNRESRHDLVNQVQRVIAEAYTKAKDERKDERKRGADRDRDREDRDDQHPDSGPQ